MNDFVKLAVDLDLLDEVLCDFKLADNLFGLLLARDWKSESLARNKGRVFLDHVIGLVELFGMKIDDVEIMLNR